MKKENLPCRVLGLGEIEFDFTLNLNEVILNKLNLDIDKVSNIEELLVNEELKNSIVISSKNNLINLLLFINKTSSNKVYAEFISLTNLSLPKEFHFLKDKMKKDFEDNYVYLLETETSYNIPETSAKIDVILNNVFYKTFYMKDNYTDNINEFNIKKQKTKDLYIDLMGDVDNTNKTEKVENDLPIILTGELDKNVVNNISIIEKGKLIEESVDKNKTFTHLPNINYEFHNCDYLLIDINEFYKKTSNMNITVKEIYEFIASKDLLNNLRMKIILVFPFDFKTVKDNETLIKLVSISDIIVYERMEAIKFCKSLGYKVEDKNFELRYVLIDELNRSNKYNRTEKHSLFLDNFRKLLVLTQNTINGGITYNVEYLFDKLKSNSKSFLDEHYEFLLFIFLGGFFSKFIKERSFDSCFKSGMIVFNKIINILVNNLPIPTDPNYFQSDKRNSNILDETTQKFYPSIKKSIVLKKEKEFNLDCLNLVSSKKNEYNPLLDNNLANYFSSSVVRKHLNKMGFIDRKGKIIEDKTIKNIVNQSNSPKSFNLQDVSKQLEKYSKKGSSSLIPSTQLPALIKLPEKDNLYQQKIVNRNNFLEEKERIKQCKFLSKTKFKGLKPISENMYSRLSQYSTNKLLRIEQDKQESKEKVQNVDKLIEKDYKRSENSDYIRRISSSERNYLNELEKKRFKSKTSNSNNKDTDLKMRYKNKELDKINQISSINSLKDQGSNVIDKPKQLMESNNELSIENKKKVFKDYKFFDNKFKLNRDKYFEESLKLLEVYDNQLRINVNSKNLIPKNNKVINDFKSKNSSINTLNILNNNEFKNNNSINNSSRIKHDRNNDMFNSPVLNIEISNQTKGNGIKSDSNEYEISENNLDKKLEILDKERNDEELLASFNNSESKLYREKKLEMDIINNSIQSVTDNKEI